MSKVYFWNKECIPLLVLPKFDEGIVKPQPWSGTFDNPYTFTTDKNLIEELKKELIIAALSEIKRQKDILYKRTCYLEAIHSDLLKPVAQRNYSRKA